MYHPSQEGSEDLIEKETDRKMEVSMKDEEKGTTIATMTTTITTRKR